jgi:hypothetical protein
LSCNDLSGAAIALPTPSAPPTPSPSTKSDLAWYYAAPGGFVAATLTKFVWFGFETLMITILEPPSPDTPSVPTDPTVPPIPTDPTDPIPTDPIPTDPIPIPTEPIPTEPSGPDSGILAKSTRKIEVLRE